MPIRDTWDSALAGRPELLHVVQRGHATRSEEFPCRIELQKVSTLEIPRTIEETRRGNI